MYFFFFFSCSIVTFGAGCAHVNGFKKVGLYDVLCEDVSFQGIEARLNLFAQKLYFVHNRLFAYF